MPPRTASQTPSRYGARDFFTYGINIQNLLAGAQSPGQFTVDAGWDFMWQKATFYAIDDTGAILTDPNLTIVITDTGTGRAMMNIPLAIPAIFGTGSLPFILPTSKLFQARATVAVLVQSNEAAINYDNVYLQFVGTQLFLA